MRKVNFAALIEAIARRDSSFSPLGSGGALELYRWMVASVDGAARDRWSWSTRWGSASLIADMGGRPGCTNVYSPEPLARAWAEDLSRRFAHALFDRGVMAEWRQHMKISADAPRFVPVERQVHVDGRLNALFDLCGSSLRASYNPCHPKAKTVERFELMPAAEGWTARIGYGYEGSVWFDNYSRRSAVLTVAQRPREPIDAYLARTLSHFAALVVPQRQEARAA